MRGTVSLADDPKETLQLFGVDLTTKRISSATTSRCNRIDAALLAGCRIRRRCWSRGVRERACPRAGCSRSRSRRPTASKRSRPRAARAARLGACLRRTARRDGSPGRAKWCSPNRVASIRSTSSSATARKSTALAGRSGARATGHLQRDRPAQRGELYEQILGSFQALLTGFSLICLVAGIYIIYNTTSTAAVHRALVLALLQITGADAPAALPTPHDGSGRSRRRRDAHRHSRRHRPRMAAGGHGLGLDGGHLPAALRRSRRSRSTTRARSSWHASASPPPSSRRSSPRAGPCRCRRWSFCARSSRAGRPAATGAWMLTWLALVIVSAGALAVGGPVEVDRVGQFRVDRLVRLLDRDRRAAGQRLRVAASRALSVAGAEGRVAAESLFRSPTRTGITVAAIALVLTLAVTRRLVGARACERRPAATTTRAACSRETSW